ncbi:META domain-containing protein [Corynebacterium xerosis]|uniref:META domain-containing protein n=1 Tax=Corynebacterium xerosis TaxID=1725 RepID=UPI00366A8850
MKRRRTVARAAIFACALVAGVMVAACGGPAEKSGPPPIVVAADISGVDWHLETDRNASFRIDGTRLHGTDSCNRLFGQVSITEGEPTTIDFGALGATRMACPDVTGAQEQMGTALGGSRLVEKPDESALVLVDESSGERWRFAK